MFLKKNASSSSKTATRSESLLKELFEIYLEAAKVQGLESEMTRKVSGCLHKIQPYRIGSKGQLLEWEEAFEEWEPSHRHISHLYGAFPGNDISRHDKTLMQAAKKSMELRGNEGTGCSLAWKTNVWARLEESEMAHRLLHRFLKLSVSDSRKNITDGGGICPNLFCSCPPMQIDGNFGITSAIAEMLMQSRVGEIILLPALPNEWTEGSIQGLVACGGIEVNLWWSEGALRKATLYSPGNLNIRVFYKDQMNVVSLESEQLKEIHFV